MFLIKPASRQCLVLEVHVCFVIVFISRVCTHVLVCLYMYIYIYKFVYVRLLKQLFV